MSQSSPHHVCSPKSDKDADRRSHFCLKREITQRKGLNLLNSHLWTVYITVSLKTRLVITEELVTLLITLIYKTNGLLRN